VTMLAIDLCKEAHGTKRHQCLADVISYVSARTYLDNLKDVFTHFSETSIDPGKNDKMAVNVPSNMPATLESP
jgi:hypothetical protein